MFAISECNNFYEEYSEGNMSNDDYFDVLPSRRPGGQVKAKSQPFL